MFLTEKDLRDAFWKSYNRKGRAIRYQFECGIRQGNADLVTIELFQDQFQINAFEFKLSDIKKAILQAQENLKYVNKSWIVIPQEKAELIQTKYKYLLDGIRYVGVMGVEAGGRYSVVYQPRFQQDTLCNQEIIKLCMQKL